MMANPYFITRTNCPACNSSQGDIVHATTYDDPQIVEYLKDFYGKQGGVEFEYLKGACYTLVSCKNCECTYQKEIPNDFLMQKLYEHWIDPVYIKNEEVENYPLNHSLYYANELANIITHFGKLPGELDFFDFGMGWGRWCLMAKAMGVNVSGTELSESRINYAKNNAIKVINYETIADEKFDFINTEQVFEHIPNPLETLEYLQKSLKPGGIIKISVPDSKYVKEALGKMDWFIPKATKYSLNIVAPLEHINAFKNKSIIKMAQKVNLKLVTMKLKVNYEFSGYPIKSPIEIAKFLFRPLHFKHLQNKSASLFFTKKITG